MHKSKKVLHAMAKEDSAALSKLGSAAHRIEDWVTLDGVTWCITPRNYWHVATSRELAMLGRSR